MEEENDLLGFNAQLIRDTPKSLRACARITKKPKSALSEAARQQLKSQASLMDEKAALQDINERLLRAHNLRATQELKHSVVVHMKWGKGFSGKFIVEMSPSLQRIDFKHVKDIDVKWCKSTWTPDHCHELVTLSLCPKSDRTTLSKYKEFIHTLTQHQQQAPIQTLIGICIIRDIHLILRHKNTTQNLISSDSPVRDCFEALIVPHPTFSSPLEFALYPPLARDQPATFFEASQIFIHAGALVHNTPSDGLVVLISSLHVLSFLSDGDMSVWRDKGCKFFVIEDLMHEVNHKCALCKNVDNSLQSHADVILPSGGVIFLDMETLLNHNAASFLIRLIVAYLNVSWRQDKAAGIQSNWNWCLPNDWEHAIFDSTLSKGTKVELTGTISLLLHDSQDSNNQAEDNKRLIKIFKDPRLSFFDAAMNLMKTPEWSKKYRHFIYLAPTTTESKRGMMSVLPADIFIEQAERSKPGIIATVQDRPAPKVTVPVIATSEMPQPLTSDQCYHAWIGGLETDRDSTWKELWDVFKGMGALTSLHIIEPTAGHKRAILLTYKMPHMANNAVDYYARATWQGNRFDGALLCFIESRVFGTVGFNTNTIVILGSDASVANADILVVTGNEVEIQRENPYYALLTFPNGAKARDKLDDLRRAVICTRRIYASLVDMRTARFDFRRICGGPDPQTDRYPPSRDRSRGHPSSRRY